MQITELIRHLSRSLKAQENPNDDPQELYRQIRPTLTKMGLQNMADRGRTQLVIGETKRDENLYKVVLRRNSEITEDTIKRLNRNVDQLNLLKWSSQAIEVYVWAPYETPAEEIVEETVP